MTITFLPDQKTIEANDYEDVFEQARKNGVAILNSCGGGGSCGLCRVKVISDEENCNELTKAEKYHLGNVFFIDKKRLACQMKVKGDVVLEVVNK